MTYLDHAATTPVYPEVIDAVADAMRECGNASAIHQAGRAARRRVEESRETIAAALGAQPSEVLFTSGGTESDNLAVIGIYRARRRGDPQLGRVVTAPIEHHAVLDAVEHLHIAQGAEIGWLQVDALGRVTADALETAIGTDPHRVALASIMWANNEIGTVNPIGELAQIAHAHGIPLHTDAVQALGQLPVDFRRSGVDAMTVTGHKIGAPVGVGVLVARRDLPIAPIGFGGGQERGIRSGTLDVAGVVGLARAIELCVEQRADVAARLTRLRDALIAGIRARVPDVELTGDRGVGTIDGGASRLPGHAHLRFPGTQADSLLMLLDAQGIAASTGSACAAGVSRPSHVLLALGMDEREAAGALRFSLGHTSTPADVQAVLDAIGEVVARARAAGIASQPPTQSSTQLSTDPSVTAPAGFVGPARVAPGAPDARPRPAVAVAR